MITTPRINQKATNKKKIKDIPVLGFLVNGKNLTKGNKYKFSKKKDKENG